MTTNDPGLSTFPRLVTCLFLGTGGSVGTPQVSCLIAPDADCPVCSSAVQDETKKNFRYNVEQESMVNKSKKKHMYRIDTGHRKRREKNYPDRLWENIQCAVSFFRDSGIYNVDALLLTHDHADACFGLDDLRALTLKQGHTPLKSPIPIPTSVPTYTEILRMFPYMEDERHSMGQGVPPFTWHPFSGSEPFTLPSCGNIEVIPLPVQHGRDHAPIRRPYMCMGFRIGDFSYLSDVSCVPEETKGKMEGTRILVLNALREKPQSAHFTFSVAKAFVKSMVPTPVITYLIGMSHDTDHYLLEEELQKWSHQEGIIIVPSYDGLQIRL